MQKHKIIGTSEESFGILRSALVGQSQHPAKKRKLEDFSPVVLALIARPSNIKPSKPGEKPVKRLSVLLDSGASKSLVSQSSLPDWVNTTKLSNPTSWTTAAGQLSTTKEARVNFVLPEFDDQRTINIDAHVTTSNMSYSMILGRDVLSQLGIKLDFQNQAIEWEHYNVPFKPRGEPLLQHIHIQEPKATMEATKRIKAILDAKYEPANLQQVVRDCVHLSESEQSSLLKILQRHESLFDGTLGKWTGEPYKIDLKADAKPYHARAYPIPRCHEQTLKHDVERLCEEGVLRKVNRSEWAAPSFIIPKKDGTVRFISDFRELNKRIRRKPYPIPHIQDMLLRLEGFKYATSLDLNMGYYHIELCPFSKELCTIVLPWGKYEYQRLPMGLCNAPDIFQERMSTLFADLEFVRAYIDDLLVITKGTWEDHLKRLDEVLKRLQQAGLKVNAKKSFFGQSEIEYLGYWISREGIQPLPKKVEAMHNIKTPTNKRQLRSFIGMINFYRDMWIRRSHVLAPLAALTSKTVKWQWTDVHQNAFDTMKRIISRQVMLAYPDFEQPFDIHTDASHYQLGAVISQNGKPIAFYSRKLNSAQTRYTTTERELLAIVETLKEFRNILLGHQIRVYTDHKNLTYNTSNIERVVRWRLIIEEFGPELLYIKGTKNIVADALSRLDITTNQPLDDVNDNAELFGLTLDELDENSFPVQFPLLDEAQKKDRKLQHLALTHKEYSLTSFLEANTKTIELITRNGKIVVPTVLQKQIVNWYHTVLLHPGESRTEATINQHFWWSGMQKTVKSIVGRCPTCQLLKRSTKQYGHLPAKTAEAEPWVVLCVDMIGPYNIQQTPTNGLKKSYVLWCVTMIDPATGWLEIKEVTSKNPITVANAIEQTWLCRYPWPKVIVYDKGGEFSKEFVDMVSEDYGIKTKQITTRNPQANAMIERAHQTIGNLLRVTNFHDVEDTQHPFDGVLSAVGFAMRATYHTTLQRTPAQLVFGRDTVLNVKVQADWQHIRQRKQTLIDKNNKRENAKRISHIYQPDDLVLFKTRQEKNKYNHVPWEGPYKILRVHDNGTVRLRRGITDQTVNIRLLKPYTQ